MFDIVAVVVNLGVIGYICFEALTNGIPSISNSYVFIAYSIFTTLTLPMLIGRSIFKQKMIGLGSALAFLSFPIEYLLVLGIAKLTGIELSTLLLATSFLNILLWNILLFIFIFSDEQSGDLSEDTLKNVFLGFIPASIYLVVFLFVRDPDSVVALDYLQHITVPNQMVQNEAFCILPAQCSNLFLQHGYTTIYHTILGFITTFSNTNPIRVFFMLDLVLPFVASIPLYSLFRRNIGNRFWAMVGVLTTLLVFVMGAYDFVFFVPQTFALLLFLFIYQERRLTPFKMILGTLLLISSHFIIGTFLAILLWLQFFTVKIFDTTKSKNVTVIMLLVTAVFFVLANIAGFSVEKLIQMDSVNVIGGVTNPYFPNNILAYLSVLGPIFLLLLISIVYFFITKRKELPSYLAIEYILVTTTAYFLAPTYANKFLIGTGIFASILIFRMTSDFNFRPIFKGLISLSVVGAFLSAFVINYNTYLRFYTQNTGERTAIVSEDMEIVKYLQREPNNNIITVSDPYTQLTVSSLTNQKSASAQYISLETRQSLYSFLYKPSNDTWRQLRMSKELKNEKDIYILYTSRLEESIREYNLAWLFNIYSLQINNNYSIKQEPEFIKYLVTERDGEVLFENSNFILVSVK